MIHRLIRHPRSGRIGRVKGTREYILRGNDMDPALAVRWLNTALCMLAEKRAKLKGVKDAAGLFPPKSPKTIETLILKATKKLLTS